jgi:hypothetical protein
MTVYDITRGNLLPFKGIEWPRTGLASSIRKEVPNEGTGKAKNKTIT